MYNETVQKLLACDDMISLFIDLAIYSGCNEELRLTNDMHQSGKHGVFWRRGKEI
jgi:hypothetical protein